MDDQRLVKGFYGMRVADYVAERLDPQIRGRVLEAVSADVRAARPEMKRNDWYPLRYVVDYFRAIDSINGDEKKTAMELQKCGEYVADEATNTFMKLLIKVLTPKMFARQFPDFWRKYHTFGEMTVNLERLDENHVSFDVDAYDYMHFIAAGFLVYVFRSLGKGEIVVKNSCPPGQKSVAKLRLDVTWS